MILTGNDDNISEIKYLLELKGHEVKLRSKYRYDFSELTISLNKSDVESSLNFTPDVPKALVKSLLKLYNIKKTNKVLGINRINIQHNCNVESDIVVNRINLMVGGYNSMYKERR
jgi:uncharacterized membrane protein YecN with MAPEG domain